MDIFFWVVQFPSTVLAAKLAVMKPQILIAKAPLRSVPTKARITAATAGLISTLSRYGLN
jgi:hypothetical protein